MIFERQADGRVLVDRETLATALGCSTAEIRQMCVPTGTLGRRAVYDLDEASVALADVAAGSGCRSGATVLVTATEAWEYLGIPAGTVRCWASRGDVAAAGRRGRRPVYRADQLLDLARLEAA